MYTVFSLFSHTFRSHKMPDTGLSYSRLNCFSGKNDRMDGFELHGKKRKRQIDE
jgi:hypothetical protein